MDPASVAVIIKLLDLAMLGITAGVSYMDARKHNAEIITEIEKLRSKLLLGEELSDTDEARLGVLVEQAQAKRKAAKAAVPAPDGYTR